MIKNILDRLRIRNEIEIAFIIGTGRCGTTMLAQMLNSHSDICVPHELQILFEYSGNGSRLYEIFQNKGNLEYEANEFIGLIRDICPHKFHEYYDYRTFFEKKKYPITDLKELVNDLFFDIARSNKKKVFIEQTPWYGQNIRILNSLFPNAKYIHMIRDGRDVALSYARTSWWSNNINENLQKWSHEVYKIRNDCENILSNKQYIEVKYEEFVVSPGLYLNRISEFLGVKFQNQMLDPGEYINYRKYSTTNGNKLSSDSRNKWDVSKQNATFIQSAYAWKMCDTYDFCNIPENVNKVLVEFGYDFSN